MTLTNYWWLLIWMFAAGGIIAWALPKQPVMVMGKREYRWTMSSAVIFVLPYIIWAGYRKGFGDTRDLSENISRIRILVIANFSGCIGCGQRQRLHFFDRID